MRVVRSVSKDCSDSYSSVPKPCSNVTDPWVLLQHLVPYPVPEQSVIGVLGHPAEVVVDARCRCGMLEGRYQPPQYSRATRPIKLKSPWYEDTMAFEVPEQSSLIPVVKEL